MYTADIGCTIVYSASTGCPIESQRAIARVAVAVIRTYSTIVARSAGAFVVVGRTVFADPSGTTIAAVRVGTVVAVPVAVARIRSTVVYVDLARGAGKTEVAGTSKEIYVVDTCAMHATRYVGTVIDVLFAIIA